MQWNCKKWLEEWPSLSDLWKVAVLFSDANQRPGKTPCGWKHNFIIIPQAAIENPLIYLDDIMSYSCAPAVLLLFGGEREGGWRFPLSCTTTVLSAADVSSCNSRSSVPHSYSYTSLRLLKWWYDNSKHTVQHRRVCVCAQLLVKGILEIKIPESQEFFRPSTTASSFLWLLYGGERKSIRR